MKDRILVALVVILAMALFLQSDANAAVNCSWFGTTSILYTDPISNNCKVGIGLIVPESKLHMRWTASGAPPSQLFDDAQIAENNGNVFIQLHGSEGDTDGSEKSILFAEPSNGAHGAIKYNGPEFRAVSQDTLGFYTQGNSLQAMIGSPYTGKNWFDGCVQVGGSIGYGCNFKFVIANDEGYFYSFAAGDTVDTFYIRHDGNVGINTTTINNILTVKQSSATDPIADAWTVYSSLRWKTNIQTIESALDMVQQLRGVRFNWIANGQRDIGLIAEEVGLVVPEVVVYEENGIDAKSVDYNRLVAILIEAIKEQQTQIDSQQAEISALKGGTNITSSGVENSSYAEEIATLEQKVASLEQELGTLTMEKETIDQQYEALETRLTALENVLATQNESSPGGFTSKDWLIIGRLFFFGVCIFGILVVRRKRIYG
jgi:hypothetical protein